jgi:hypothetical protein
MCYELLVLVLFIVKLSKQPSKSLLEERCTLTRPPVFRFCGHFRYSTNGLDSVAFLITNSSLSTFIYFGFLGSDGRMASFVLLRNSTHAGYGEHEWQVTAQGGVCMT